MSVGNTEAVEESDKSTVTVGDILFDIGLCILLGGFNKHIRMLFIPVKRIKDLIELITFGSVGNDKRNVVAFIVNDHKHALLIISGRGELPDITHQQAADQRNVRLADLVVQNVEIKLRQLNDSIPALVNMGGNG